MKKRLTAEQAAFAAEHHDLVEQFLNQHQLPRDEYYDVVIFGFLKSVPQFLSGNIGTDFLSIAFAHMEQAVMKFLASCPAQTINTLNSGGTILALEETWTDTRNEIDGLIERIQLESILQNFAESEQEILSLLLAGFSRQEVRRKLHLSLQQFSKIMYRIQTKAAEVLMPFAA